MINCVTGGAIINTKSISRPFEICESVAADGQWLSYIIIYYPQVSKGVVIGRRRGGDGEEGMTDQINLVS